MSVTLTFHRVSEKVPQHAQRIIWLRQTSSFGYMGFEPQEIEVEYQLVELDDEGEDSGSAVCWNKEDKGRQLGDEFEVNGIKYRVEMLFDFMRASPDDLWIDVEEYWAAFDK